MVSPFSGFLARAGMVPIPWGAVISKGGANRRSSAKVGSAMSRKYGTCGGCGNGGQPIGLSKGLWSRHGGHHGRPHPASSQASRPAGRNAWIRGVRLLGLPARSGHADRGDGKPAQACLRCRAVPFVSGLGNGPAAAPAGPSPRGHGAQDLRSATATRTAKAGREAPADERPNMWEILRRSCAKPAKSLHNVSYGAAMLADVLAGGGPAGANCPVAIVVISGGGKADRPVGSPEVKALVGWGHSTPQLMSPPSKNPGWIRQEGKQIDSS